MDSEENSKRSSLHALLCVLAAPGIWMLFRAYMHEPIFVGYYLGWVSYPDNPSWFVASVLMYGFSALVLLGTMWLTSSYRRRKREK